MREKIQQVSCKKKSGQKASVGVFSVAESTSFTRNSGSNTSTENCRAKAAGSREAVEKTATEVGYARRILRHLSPSGLLIAIVKLYQMGISPWLPPCCRFQPTCSAYAKEALHEHGFIKGLYLSSWRILRCHPFCKGGYDPVPPKKELRASQLHNIRGVK
jgi:putative membrane protein insertion efficiency factor